MSKGKDKSARSITDQHRDNLAAETDHGPWTWGESYKDTGSASWFTTRVYNDFERLPADLTSGAFGEPGDVLVLWEVSRLARETGWGVALIDAVETGGHLIHVTSLDRTFNPRNHGDRHSLISGINDAEKGGSPPVGAYAQGRELRSRRGLPARQDPLRVPAHL